MGNPDLGRKKRKKENAWVYVCARVNTRACFNQEVSEEEYVSKREQEIKTRFR